VNDDDRGQLALRLRGSREVAARLLGALRRWIGHVLGLDPLVRRLHLLGPREVGLQALEHRERREAADRILRGALEEVPTIQRVVNVAVEQLENLRRVVTRLLAIRWRHHGRIARVAPKSGSACPDVILHDAM
jgi:hypothetical protein